MVDATDSRKPESSPPVSAKSFEHVDDEDYGHAKAVIEPALKWLKAEYPTLYGLLDTVAGFQEDADHAAYKRWKARSTRENRFLNWGFDKAIRIVEERIHKEHPKIELTVNIKPAERVTEDVNRREAAYSDRKWGTRESLIVLYEDWLERTEVHGFPSEKAKRDVADRRGVNPKKVERAITEIGKERRA